MKKYATYGFTLVETLIAVTILALMGTLTFATLANSIRSRDTAVEITDQYHQIRQALSRMSREISMAFLSLHKDCTDVRTNTIFLGKRNSHGMRLDYTSFSHYKVRVDAKESDENALSYFVETSKNNHLVKNLIRREKNRIDENPELGGDEQILAENIESINFSFYNVKTDRWEDEWDASRAETKNILPKFVRIQLVSKDHAGKDLVFVTKTRIFLQAALLIPGAGFIPCVE